jgi:molybdopterin-containing oxidoreductase family iron-sulfur binding subunit
MTYNRCVGTRYCSNNCPYKVRRFNYLAYSEAETARVPAIVNQRNPAVTVRSRGVMEKCTYCVQRLPRVPGSAPTMTACQQACPTHAIHFGALEDPLADVATLRDEPHHYELLGELGTRPRTTYLGRIRNRNPGLVG